MTHRAFHLVAGIIFAAVSLLHLARLEFGVAVTLDGGWTLPMWISWPGFLVAGALSVWALRIWDTDRRGTRRAEA